MIKQKDIVIKTASATLTYAEMGDIVVNSSSNRTITLPIPNTGLWYRISNVGIGVVTVYYGSALTTLKQTEQCLCLANGTSNWFFSKGGSAGSAKDINYDNTISDLDATNIQDAIDEVKSQVSVKTNFTAMTFPMPNDDATIGYSIGSNWFDNINKIAYVCLDATEDNAVWIKYASIPEMEEEIFTTSGIFTVPIGVSSVDVLVVAGGGSGGHDRGGGGGAGGLLYTENYSVTENEEITVIVGTGGLGVAGSIGSSGGNSSFGTLIAIGGGGGGSLLENGVAGGSGGGGGGRGTRSGGNGLDGQGYKGGNTSTGSSGTAGAGGGGAGGVGINNTTTNVASNGGSGILIWNNYYAGGGGGGGSTAGGIGGSTIGGVGGSNSVSPTNGTPNTGSGGGGCGISTQTAGSGADGIVIVRWESV